MILTFGLTIVKKKLGLNGISHVGDVTTDIVEKSDTWMYDMLSAMDYATQTDKQIMLYIDSPNSKWSKKDVGQYFS